jgi:putative Mn2+ efflux pump MntP
MLWHKLFFLIALAIAANLDNLGVGIAYGLRRRYISAPSNVLIALLAVALTFISMMFGSWVAQKISVQAANSLGAVILMGIGIWVFFETAIEATWTPIYRWFWQRLLQMLTRLFPLLIQIWVNRKHRQVDLLRRQGSIELRHQPRFIGLKETLILGISLSLNAMAEGFGASLSGYHPLFVSFAIGGVSYITIDTGQKVAKTYTSRWVGPFAQKLAGLLLILIGVYEFFF